MYRNQHRTPPIYGVKCVEPVSECPSDDMYLEMLHELLLSIETVVDKFFPPHIGFASVIGDMNVETSVPAFIVIRLMWANAHPGIKYTNSEYQQLELIELYLQNPGFDWRDDKYITVNPQSINSSA